MGVSWPPPRPDLGAIERAWNDGFGNGNMSRDILRNSNRHSNNTKPRPSGIGPSLPPQFLFQQKPHFVWHNCAQFNEKLEKTTFRVLFLNVLFVILEQQSPPKIRTFRLQQNIYLHRHLCKHRLL
jgi:hypothetical protein